MTLRTLALTLALLTPILLPAQEKASRWHILNNGSIEWTVKPGDPHFDHIEMSGQQVSMHVRYAVDIAQNPDLLRTIIFPNFRMKPNDTHGTLMVSFTASDLPRFFLNMTPMKPSLINGYQNPGLIEKVI
jgi:hypothetical protein